MDASRIESTHIYCPVCKSVQPMAIHRPGGADTSGEFDRAVEMRCGTCNYNVATTYSVRSAADRQPT
jgi:hypothetical protein